MRPDMASKIVERPRGSHWAPNADVLATRHHARTASPDELADMPRCGRMLPRAGVQKSFSDFLAPLRRFLQRRLGRPWDDVYSEIRERIAPASTVQIHVMEHLWEFVSLRVVVEGGRVYDDGRGWRHGRELHRTGHHFYVHPATGRLCEPVHGRERRPRRASAPERLDRGDGHLYLCLGGQWYAVETRPVPTDVAAPWDVVLRQAVHGSNDVARAGLYGQRGLHATSKRQLGRKALREAGLR